MRALFLPLLLFVSWLNGFAANLVVIDKSSGQSHARQQVEEAANFYGLSMEIDIADRTNDGVYLKAIRDPRTLAVVVTADALADLDQKKVLAALRHNGGQIPLLIVGINEHTGTELL